MYKNEAVNKAIKEKRFLQQYVKDSMGVRKGLAIALKDFDENGNVVIKMGLSLMHPEDRSFVKSKLIGFPAINHTVTMLKEAAKVDDISDRLVLVEMYTRQLLKKSEMAARRLVPVDVIGGGKLHYFSYPTFNRDTAIRLAYEDATQLHGFLFEWTRDKDAQETCKAIAQRAAAYFKVDIDPPTYKSMRHDFDDEEFESQLDYLLRHFKGGNTGEEKF